MYDECSVKGGSELDLVKGLPEEQDSYIGKLMDKLDFDEEFFTDMICECDGFSDEDAIEYFSDDDDYYDDDEEKEENPSLTTYKKIKEALNEDDSPFEDIYDFVEALECYGLEEGKYYYKWEDACIELYENIEECGMGRGDYDSYSNEEWINILKNIDDYILA